MINVELNGKKIEQVSIIQDDGRNSSLDTMMPTNDENSNFLNTMNPSRNDI
jgi:hypothetical protein